jgi:hypothetical protein
MARTGARRGPNSIQAEADSRGHKSASARLNDRTLKTATRRGMRITGADYKTVIRMRREDGSIVDTAVALQRTYYGTSALFASVGLMMRCWPEIVEAMNEGRAAARRRLRR